MWSGLIDRWDTAVIQPSFGTAFNLLGQRRPADCRKAFSTIARYACRSDRLAPIVRYPITYVPPVTADTIKIESKELTVSALRKRYTTTSVGSSGINGGSKVSLRRSEERRVGKECRSRWSPYNEKNK